MIDSSLEKAYFHYADKTLTECTAWVHMISWFTLNEFENYQNWLYRVHQIKHKLFFNYKFVHSILNFSSVQTEKAEFIPGTKMISLKYMKIFPLFCDVKNIKIDWSNSLCIHNLAELISDTQNVEYVVMTGIKNQSSNTWADDITIPTFWNHVTWWQSTLQQMVFPILWKTQQQQNLILPLFLQNKSSIVTISLNIL